MPPINILREKDTLLLEMRNFGTYFIASNAGGLAVQGSSSSETFAPEPERKTGEIKWLKKDVKPDS